jgi:hypothetical protein
VGLTRKSAPKGLAHSRKRPDARRFPDDTRRAPQPNCEPKAFGRADSDMSKDSWQKPAVRVAPGGLRQGEPDELSHPPALQVVRGRNALKAAQMA